MFSSPIYGDRCSTLRNQRTIKGIYCSRPLSTGIGVLQKGYLSQLTRVKVFSSPIYGDRCSTTTTIESVDGSFCSRPLSTGIGVLLLEAEDLDDFKTGSRPLSTGIGVLRKRKQIKNYWKKFSSPIYGDRCSTEIPVKTFYYDNNVLVPYLRG